MKTAAMLRGAVATCSLMPMPDTNSAARAEVTPSMAKRELIVSGAAHSTKTSCQKFDVCGKKKYKCMLHSHTHHILTTCDVHFRL